MSRFLFLFVLNLTLVLAVGFPVSTQAEDGFAAMQTVSAAMYSAGEEMQVKMELSGPGAPSGPTSESLMPACATVPAISIH